MKDFSQGMNDDLRSLLGCPSWPERPPDESLHPHASLTRSPRASRLISNHIRAGRSESQRRLSESPLPMLRGRLATNQTSTLRRVPSRPLALDLSPPATAARCGTSIQKTIIHPTPLLAFPVRGTFRLHPFEPLVVVGPLDVKSGASMRRTHLISMSNIPFNSR